MAATLRETAMNYLARREHSRRELEQKLAQKGYEAEDIRADLDRLVEDGLLSDARFAEAFVHARRQRGHGPLKIQAELKQRGVDDGLIQHCLEMPDDDWYELAREARGKRFGAALPESHEQRLRQSRFLQQRGFTHAQIRAAMKAEQ